MKKYIAFIVAFVLLVAAIIVPQSVSSGVKAGEGKGENFEVDSFKALVKSAEKTIKGGVTLYLSGESTSDMSLSAKGSDSSSKSRVRFEAERYISKKGAQYTVCTATIFNSSSSYIENDDEDINISSGTAITVSYEEYSYGKDKFYKINSYEASGEDDKNFAAIVIGKWIDATMEIDGDSDDDIAVGMFLASVSSAYSTASAQISKAQGLYTTFLAIDDKYWDESGSSIKLDDDDTLEAVAKSLVGRGMNKDDEYKADVEISFADKEAPKFKVNASANYESEDDSGNVDVSAGANFVNYEVVMTNIGNTIVEEDIDKDDIFSAKELKTALKNSGLMDRYYDFEEEEEDDE